MTEGTDEANPAIIKVWLSSACEEPSFSSAAAT